MLRRNRVLYMIVRSIATTCRHTSNHYDVLGLTPKATQADIKTAYYKLSKVYHPDISSDETSAKKFRAIAEAYEVLGNITLKKMYDKGIIIGRHSDSSSHMDLHPEPEEPLDPTTRFYRSHAQRNVAPTMDGRRPVYDFDAWSKHHYGNLFSRQQYEKEFLRKKKQKQTDRIKSTRQEAFIYALVALGGLFLMLVVHGQPDYDKDLVGKVKPTQKADGK